MIWNVEKLLLLYIFLHVTRQVKALPISKCPDRQMYMEILNNGSEHCVRCTICPAGYRIKIACTINSDTVCEQCLSGSYSTGNGRACQPCSECKPGTYRKHRCNSTMDVECTRCPNGTFSNNGNTWRCLPCKFCKPYQSVLKECEPSSNYLCGDCDNDHFFDRSTGGCLPCSPCRPGQDNIEVPECARKQVDTRSICLPSNFIPPPEHDVTAEATTGVDDGRDQLPDNTTVLTIALAVITVCAIILFLVFLLLVHCQPLQKCLRFCRDVHVHQISSCSSKTSKTHLQKPVTTHNTSNPHSKFYTVFRNLLKNCFRYILCKTSQSMKAGTRITETKCPAIALLEEAVNIECCNEGNVNEVPFEGLSVSFDTCLSKEMCCTSGKGVQRQSPLKNDKSMFETDEQDKAEQVSRISVKPEPSMTSTVVTVHDLPLLESSTSGNASLEDEVCAVPVTANTDYSTIVTDTVSESRRKKRRRSLRTSGSFCDSSIFQTCKYTTL